MAHFREIYFSGIIIILEFFNFNLLISKNYIYVYIRVLGLDDLKIRFFFPILHPKEVRNDPVNRLIRGSSRVRGEIN